MLLVDNEELLTRCVAILFSSERLVCLLPTALLTVLARTKPVPEFVFVGPQARRAFWLLHSVFRAAELLNEARLLVR